MAVSVMCAIAENSMGVVSLCAGVLRRHATVQLEALKGSREEYKRLMASNVEKAERVKACVLHSSLPLLYARSGHQPACCCSATPDRASLHSACVR